MSHRIFIGWDQREAECADVLSWSLRKHSSVNIDIQYLKLDELKEKWGYQPIERPASTEFAFTRFLIPWLCGYRGTAWFLDCDMVCLSDPSEVLNLSIEGLAIRCTKHDYVPDNTIKMDGQPQVSYPRKLWSSCMLLNCYRLRHWTKAVVENVSGAYLHRFMDVPDVEIGEIPLAWNDIRQADQTTKLCHLTNGGPWFPQCQNVPNADVWLAARNEMRQASCPPRG